MQSARLKPLTPLLAFFFYYFFGTLADTRDLGFVIGETLGRSARGCKARSRLPGFILAANTEAGNNRRSVPPRATNTSLLSDGWTHLHS